jgi:hypothetical protein
MDVLKAIHLNTEVRGSTGVAANDQHTLWNEHPLCNAIVRSAIRPPPEDPCIELDAIFPGVGMQIDSHSFHVDLLDVRSQALTGGQASDGRINGAWTIYN